MSEPNNVSAHQVTKKTIVFEPITQLKTEPDTMLHKPEDPHNKNNLTTQLIFPPSFKSAIFTMTSLTIGTGCLTFVKKAISFGFVWFSVILVIGGFATYWTLVGLIHVAKKEGDTEYSSVCRKVIGRIPAVLTDILTIIYGFGIIITYEIIINSLIGRVVYVFCIDKDKYKNFDAYESLRWDTIKVKAIILVSLTILLIPLCLAKDIGKMKVFGYFGIASLGYTIVVLIIECPFFYSYYLKNVYVKEDKSTHSNWYDITKAFNSDLDFFTGFATIVFAYANHQGALPVYRSLQTVDETIMEKIFSRSIILTMVIYLATFISSFLTTPLKSEDLIIFRESIFSNDIFMNIAQISIILELFFLLPGKYNSMRCSVFHLIFGNEKIRTIPNIIITLTTFILSALIGACYRKILNYISLLGGFCCTTISFLIPGWMMIKVDWKTMNRTKKILSLTGISIICIIGYVGGIQSAILFFK